MSEKVKISVVTPSFNEKEAIEQLIEDIKKNTKDYEAEILVVDSGTDGTQDIAAQLGARVIWQKPQGHGVALRTAISQAKHDIIITTDCDNTYPMNYIPIMVDLIAKEGYDIISGNRLTKELGSEMPLSNKMANIGFAFLVRLLYRINVHDVTTGMFCMRRSVNERIKFEHNYSLPCEIVIKSNLSGFKHKEIDISYTHRIGQVKLKKWISGKAYLRCIFNYKFNLKIDPKKM